MGVRGEIFSNKVILPNRTYFFNVKENRMGDLYLNIVESKNRETGGFDRQSVILFADDLQEFLKGFDESLHVLEKAVREKRRTGGENPKHRGDFHARDDKAGGQKPRNGFKGEKSWRDDKDGKPKQRRDFNGERNEYAKQRKPFGSVNARPKQRNEYSSENGRPKQKKVYGGDNTRSKQRQAYNGEKSERGFKSRKSDHGPGKNRRVIVKKYEK